MKVRVLKPVSTGETKKGEDTKFYKVGSVVEINDKDFSELNKLGFVEKVIFAAKTKEEIPVVKNEIPAKQKKVKE